MQTTETEHVRFDISSTDAQLVRKVLARAKENGLLLDDAQSFLMDLAAAKANGCPIDFQALLDSDQFDFWHDVVKIQQYIDRETGKFLHCFIPLCARGGK